MDTEATLKKPDSNALAEQRTDLAVERTLLAADRTMMAWIRTAISMIGFGFTLYKFLEYMVQQKDAPLVALHRPRNLGLAFIALGGFSLVVAVVQDWQFTRRVLGPGMRKPFNPSLVVAAIVALIEVFAFMSVLFRIGPF
jgi:putative membrane protein